MSIETCSTMSEIIESAVARARHRVEPSRSRGGRVVREEDEWFNEPDDLDRVQRALNSIAGLDDLIEAAAVLAYRVARAQDVGEGNKRTALALAKWLLDRNGYPGER